MKIDYQAWAFWWNIFQTLLTGCVFVYVWFSTRTDATSTAIDSLRDDADQRLDEHDRRLTRVEEVIKHSPTHDDLKSIHKRIDGVSTDIANLSGKVGEVGRTLNLIHEHLLNGEHR